MTYTLPLSERALHIGRAPDNDLVLADDMVSWHHATLWQEQGQVWVRDRGSRNGTFLNDTAIRDAARVPDGARIRLGTRAWKRRATAGPVGEGSGRDQGMGGSITRGSVGLRCAECALQVPHLNAGPYSPRPHGSACGVFR